MMGKLVSVIIPAYNSGAYIGEAIDSVLGQTYKNIEIIVVDDGSIDNTKDVVGGYSEGKPVNMRYYFQKNRGPGIARNLGIKEASGEYIAFLDSDDIWEPDKLGLQMEILEGSRSFDMVHTDFVYFYENGAVRSSEYPDRTKKYFSGDIFLGLFKGNFIRTSTVMVRKEVLERTGGFDPDLFMSEDYDLWLRMTKGRSVTGYINKPLLKVRQHNAHITGDARETYKWVARAIEKTVDFSPEFGKELKKILPYRLAKNHFTIGYKLFTGKSYKEARQEFFKSLRYRLSIKTVIYILGSFLGAEIINRLKTLKRGMRHETIGKRDNTYIQ